MSEPFTRALLFVKQGRYREAEYYLRQAIQNDPQDPQSFFFLATCLMRDPKNRSEALAMIDKALRLCPDRAFYHAQRGGAATKSNVVSACRRIGVSACWRQ